MVWSSIFYSVRKKPKIKLSCSFKENPKPVRAWDSLYRLDDLGYNGLMKWYSSLLIFVILACGCQDNRPVTGIYPSTGLATWYNPRLTASGERYKKGQFTAAMRKRGFGKYYLVCNLENNKCVEVRHNDFGPAAYLFRRGRIIDLSRNAFSKIADERKGVIKVRIGEVYSGIGSGPGEF